MNLVLFSLFLLIGDRPYDYHKVIQPVLRGEVVTEYGRQHFRFSEGRHHLIAHPVQMVVFQDTVTGDHFQMMAQYAKRVKGVWIVKGACQVNGKLGFVEIRYDTEGQVVTLICEKARIRTKQQVGPEGLSGDFG